MSQVFIVRAQSRDRCLWIWYLRSSQAKAFRHRWKILQDIVCGVFDIAVCHEHNKHAPTGKSNRQKPLALFWSNTPRLMIAKWNPKNSDSGPASNLYQYTRNISNDDYHFPSLLQFTSLHLHISLPILGSLSYNPLSIWSTTFALV